MAAGRVWIGCSGWQYAAWKGTFYPRSLPISEWQAHYAAHFRTVEVNNTFYRLPEREVFERWATGFPRGFCVAIKASGYLTHRKRLREPEEPVTRLFERVDALGSKLGPVLYQLPATLKRDLERLDGFMRVLPRHVRRRRVHHVMEFRDSSWYERETFALLERHGVSLCLHDKKGSEYAQEPIGPIVYIRFHGTSGHYRGSYPTDRLRKWAERIDAWRRAGRDVFAYFNNDPDASAVRNAQTLMTLVSELRN